MESFLHAINNLLNFIINLAPLIGLGIAGMGLDTWRRQIRGTDKYKVASELLLEVYRVREGIAVSRSSFIQFSPTDDKNLSKEMNEFYGLVRTMEQRWKEVSEPVAQLYLLALKAEVHLNKDIKKKVDDYMKLVRELRVTYEQYVDVKRPDSRFTAEDFDKEANGVLWAKPTNDEFKGRLTVSVEGIESIARSYL